VLAVCVTAVAAVGLFVVVRELSTPRDTRALAHRLGPKLPAASPDTPQRVAGPGGTVVDCPRGSVPAITFTEAAFSPPLRNGTSFTAGEYHIRLRGTVVNETTQPIAITGVTVTIGGAPWRPRIDVPPGLSATSSADVVVEGVYASTQGGAADVSAHLAWQWVADALRPCADAGLVEDD
jgi:hypothetical protein